MNDNYSLTFAGRRYKFNLTRLYEICFATRGKQDADREITEVFENDENGELQINSKVIREMTDANASQDDMITYDFIKSITLKLMDYNITALANENDVNFGFALAFNTLLSEGIIEEIS